MRVAVTGASGHAGASLVRALLARGDRVRVLLRADDRAVRGLDVESVEGDLLAPRTLAPLVAGAELVFHLAARVSISGGRCEELERVNVLGVRHVAEAALAAGVRRLVHFSSIHALDSRPADRPVDEARPFVGAGAPPYDRSKAAGEREIRAAAARGLDAVIVQPTAIVGPFDFKPSHAGRLIVALARRRLPALIDGAFDWVDARDVARTALAAGDAGRAGERYLVPGHRVSIRDFAREVARAAGVAAPRLVTPLWAARLGAPLVAFFARRLGRAPLYTPASVRAVGQNSRVCGDKARAELGHRARPFAETIADTVGWLRENGQLDSR